MWFKKQNNKNKFTNWVKLHHQALYKHALWMTGNSDNAKDAVQETYHQAWLSISKLRDDKMVLSWLLTILRRTVYREFRHKYQYEEFLQTMNPVNDEFNENNGQDDLLDVVKMMEQLPTSHRETLLLYALHGFTYQEVGEQLNIPVGTVMSRISRARNEIKSSINLASDNVIHLKLLNKSH